MPPYPTLKIAGVQSDVDFHDPNVNFNQLVERSLEAKKNGARYVVFPECFLTGYCYESKAELADASLPHDHSIFQAIKEFTAKEKIAVSCGSLFLAKDNKHYNSVLTWDNGQLIHLYHKVHLPFLGVDRFVTPGENIASLFEIDGVKIGMHICYEGGFPEIGRSLSLAGADLLVLPTNWPPGSGVSCDAIPACRSLENKVYFMAVNRIGTEQGTPFIGNSSITDTVGKQIDKAGSEASQILYANIDTKPAREKKVVHTAGVYEVDRIGDRRPDLYGKITEPQAD